MRFEWDEAKRQSNLLKHRLDFEDAQALFDGRPVAHSPARYVDEERFSTTGVLQGK
jgi:uncharacterized protein